MLFFFQQKTNEAFATAIKRITVTREQLTNTGVAVPLRRRQTIFLNVFRAYLRKHLTRLHFYRWRSSELLSGSLTNKQRKLFKERGKLCISFMQQRYNHGPQNERPPAPTFPPTAWTCTRHSSSPCAHLRTGSGARLFFWVFYSSRVFCLFRQFSWMARRALHTVPTSYCRLHLDECVYNRKVEH